MARNKFNIDEELESPFDWQQFKRSLIYIKRYKKELGLMLFLSIVTSILGLITPKLQAYIIDDLIHGKLPDFLQEIGAIGWIAVII